MSKDQFERSVQTLEAFMLTQPQVALEVKHHFAPGVYLRELRIPAGVMVTGAIHKAEHLCIIAAGLLRIADVTGERVLSAPSVLLSKPGIKRAAFALEDSVFITVHGTQETDIDTLERTLVATTYAEYQDYLTHVQATLEAPS